MDKHLSVKNVAKHIMAFLLVFTILFSNVLPTLVHAENYIFSGTDDIEVEENSLFDLLEGVSALNADGKELWVTIKDISCNTDFTYEDQTEITIGPAGTVYKVEYIASSDGNDSEVYSVIRTITSIPASNSTAGETPEPVTPEIGEPSTGDGSEQNIPDGGGSSTDGTTDGGGSSADGSQEKPTDPEATPPTEAPEAPALPEDEIDEESTPDEEIDESSQEEKADEEGLPIIFEGGLHYIEDPQYPGERLILYCMNNKLAWPHSTGEHPHVPNYSEGYLTPDLFESEAQYNECIQKLRKLLFAGYPYNGERLYQIVESAELHVPTEHEFNDMLIVPPQLENDFPYLGHHEFTLSDVSNEKHFNELLDFMNSVFRLYPNGTTPSGISYLDIISMPFYKAANSLTFSGFNASKDDVLSIFAQLYSSSYFVTEVQAYDATQFAVWRLLNEYNIENNDIHSLENNELSKVLWQYCQHGALLDRLPSYRDIWIEGKLSFSFNPKDGMWHSGKLKIHEPVEYNGLYHLVLPEGVTAICDGLTYVYGNEEYELVSIKRPQPNDKFLIYAEIDWLENMKQYSPIGATEFQHMVGAVIRSTPISQVIPYDSDKYGSLEISKNVVGEQEDLSKEFAFTLELSGLSEPLNGLYGDFDFHDNVAEFTLKHGETLYAPHLPHNAHYKITELDHDSYLVSANGLVSDVIEGEICQDGPVEVKFTNVKLKDLLVSKTVQGEMGNHAKPFTFIVEIKNEDGTPLQGTYNYVGSVKEGFENESQAPSDGTLTFMDGKTEFTLSHGQQIRIKGIPITCAYTVTEKEANQDGYTTTYNQGSQPVSGSFSGDCVVHVVNRLEYVPPTGIDDMNATGFGIGVCLALVGLVLPAFYSLLRRKKGHSNDR